MRRAGPIALVILATLAGCLAKQQPRHISQSTSPARSTARATVEVGLPGAGDGFPVGRVAFPEIRDLQVARDGKVYVLTEAALCRFRPGGKLERLAGGAHTATDEPTGQDARAVGFGLERLTLALQPDDQPVLGQLGPNDTIVEAMYGLDRHGRLTQVQQPAVRPSRPGKVRYTSAAGEEVDGVSLHGTTFALPDVPGEGSTIGVYRQGQPKQVVDVGNIGFMEIFGAALGPDNAVYAFGTRRRGRGWMVMKLPAHGPAAMVVGGEPASLGAPGETGLAPAAIAARGPHDLIVYDEDRARILRVRPGHPVEALTRPWTGQDPPPGTPAAGAALAADKLEVDARGRLYVLNHGASIYRFVPGGKLERLYGVHDPASIRDFTVGRDGSLYVSPNVKDNLPGPVLRVQPGKAAMALPQATSGAIGLAMDPHGALCLLWRGGPAERLLRWTPAHGLEQLGEIHRGRGGLSHSSKDRQLAVDPAGRWWFPDGPPEAAGHATPFAALSRFEPRTRRLQLMAGDGQALLGGSTVDDSLSSVRGFSFDSQGDLFVSDEAVVRRVAGAGR